MISSFLATSLQYFGLDLCSENVRQGSGAMATPTEIQFANIGHCCEHKKNIIPKWWFSKGNPVFQENPGW